jgi:hypothetical protein
MIEYIEAHNVLKNIIGADKFVCYGKFGKEYGV